MINENDGTGIEQSMGWVQVMKWATTDYRLWYSLTVKELIMVVKPLNKLSHVK
jgi:hypothetical protein